MEILIYKILFFLSLSLFVYFILKFFEIYKKYDDVEEFMNNEKVSVTNYSMIFFGLIIIISLLTNNLNW